MRDRAIASKLSMTSTYNIIKKPCKIANRKEEKNGVVFKWRILRELEIS
jgi:hypothetical protein